MSLQPTRDFAVDVYGIASELSSSPRKLKIFQAVYSGGSKPKDARILARMTALDRVTVLQLASPMAHKGYFEVVKHHGLLAYKKYKEINAVRHHILRLARNASPKKNWLSSDGRRPARKSESPSASRTRATTTAKRYDVALSFAGEDRKYAESLARMLKKASVSVFYDAYEKADLWGTDLYAHLKNVYANRSQYCVVFVSKHYKRKLWTKHELKAAQEKAFRQHKSYILPVQVDSTKIPSLFRSTGFLDLKSEKIEGIFQALLTKLGRLKKRTR